MRVVVPQIAWHNREPVLSIDFDPTSKGDEGFYRVASGGGDCQLLVWRLAAADTLKPELTCVAELKRHEKSVNIVRFSPDGSYIVTGGDDAYIILWKCDEVKGSEENWQFEKSLRKHIEDVSDLSWSPDGLFLISASIDNSAVLWDVKKGLALEVWSEKEHNGFVHGVAYDPLQELAATMCIDRNLRFFDLKTKKTAHKALKYPDLWISDEIKEELDVIENEKDTSSVVVCDGDEAPTKKRPSNYVNRLFQDEFLPTFCRRLSFSPRGELLLVPGGLLPPCHSSSGSLNIKENKENEDKSSDDDCEKKGKDKKIKKKVSSNNNAVVIFCRHSWTTPCAVIPTLDSYSTATRFCPIYFQKYRKAYSYDQGVIHPKKNERSFSCIAKIAAPKDESQALMKMPYRLVFAVATNDTVIISDTASSTPLAVIRSIHMARITDITWAANGRALMVSSTDGYCSIITFEKGELGEEYCVEPEIFPVLTRDCFPVLPLEPKKEKQPKKKTPKAKGPVDGKVTKDKEAKSEAKTPTSIKKKSIQAKNKNIEAMFTAVTASSSPGDNVTSTSCNAREHNEEKQVAVEGEEQRPKTETEIDSNQSTVNSNSDGTPTRKRTLDTWIRKTPKTSSSISIDGSPLRPEKSCENPVEIIVLDDEEVESGPEKLAVFSNSPSSAIPPRKYPMTPPVKPIAVRRLSTTIASPSHLVLSPNGPQKRKQGEVTPEELHRLKTAPIKYRKIMEEPQPIMESNDSIRQQRDADADNISNPQRACELTEEILASPKVTDPNCPPSPVSSASSTPRAPRRITLTTLTPAKQSEPGKLD